MIEENKEETTEEMIEENKEETTEDLRYKENYNDERL